MGQKHELLLALADENGAARGGVWRITAKKTDFYLDCIRQDNGGIHLSVHGPNERFKNHRFHIKTDRRKAPQARDQGVYLEKALDKGVEVKGIKLAEHAYHVARLRWTWDLQRPRYRHAALTRVPLPELEGAREGACLDFQLGMNSAWDIDLIISYDKPYWMTDFYWSKPQQIGSHPPMLGPLKNEAGMYLTATSIYRSLMTDPGPARPLLPRPKNNRDAVALTVGGLGEGKLKDICWFEETIASQEFLHKYNLEVKDNH